MGGESCFSDIPLAVAKIPPVRNNNGSGSGDQHQQQQHFSCMQHLSKSTDITAHGHHGTRPLRHTAIAAHGHCGTRPSRHAAVAARGRRGTRASTHVAPRRTKRPYEGCPPQRLYGRLFDGTASCAGCVRSRRKDHPAITLCILATSSTGQPWPSCGKSAAHVP